jgi:hypothetical protein
MAPNPISHSPGPVSRASLGVQAEIDRPGPQQPQIIAVDRDDRRFETMLGRATIDDQRDAAVQAGEHMLGPGRADPAARIGGGRGERPAAGGDQRAHRRMRRRPQRDRRQAGRDQ